MNKNKEEVSVEVVKEVTDELVNAWKTLLPQLSSSAEPLTRQQLDDIVRDEDVTMLIARFGNAIVGSLSLVVFRIPDGVRAWIESVVVDETMRGKGVGRLLSETAVEIALQKNAKSIDLTSRSSRIAANKLYQSVGFQRRETNVYRYRG